MANLIGAVDLGGTKILALAVGADGAVHGEDVRPTEAEGGPEHVVARIRDSLRAALSATGGGTFSAAGVTMPGPIDIQRGTADPPNLTGWRGFPAVARLSSLLGCPTVIENDANAAAWGEYRLGAGRGADHLIYLTVSTGVGGGLVLDRRLYRGAQGAAGELGHIQLVDDGPLCGCGAYGCLEQLASGTAIAREARALLHQGHDGPLATLARDEGDVTAETVARAAAEGDTAARAIIERAGRYLGRGLTAYVNIFNPDAIVIGGGTAKIGPTLLDPAIAAMRATAFPRLAEHVRVETAALGDRAGALGAAELAREAAQSR